MDTIFALATARGKAGIAVIRVSGPSAYPAARALVGDLPPLRQSGVRKLRDRNGAVIDEALVLPFARGHSFTGEDVGEFHIHGSPAVVASVLSELGDMDGLREAEAGEFTRRALENDLLDLAQVEGLADLVDAETEAQRRLAMRVFSGELGEKVLRWREKLVRAMALIEATIDFADEDVPVDVSPEVQTLLADVASDFEKEREGAGVAERIRDGFEVAIVGAPNVGKSTLLNYLAGREAAITSEFAGTTRDVIEVRMDLDGLPVTFLDTAGIRDSAGVIEAIGVKKTRERAERADLRVFLGSGCSVNLGVTRHDEDLVVQCKADVHGGDGLAVSGKTGMGVDRLLQLISKALGQRASVAGVATKERHRRAISDALLSVEAARAMLANGPEEYDILAEELRAAATRLDALVGRVDVEHLLDEIFSRFCIGK